MRRSIKIDWKIPADYRTLDTPFPPPERIYPGLDEIAPATFPDFLDEIGLAGMGGAGFPASRKIKENYGSHTLVINGVECEPGITIDQALLLSESLWVAAGAAACAQAIGAARIVLAVKDDPDLIQELAPLYPEFEITGFPDRYPAGAEKLILKKLAGQSPPPGIRPSAYGILVQNTASLRAVGRAIIDGIPVVERPLTLAMPSTGFYKNLIAPVGLAVQELLEIYKLPYDPCRHLIIDSGLMMGRETGAAAPIEKTTLSVIVLPRDNAFRTERPCTRCGACNAACPLGLHPFSLTEKIRKGKIGGTAFKAQMTECFLCGLCAAVCPSGLPLAESLKKGKECL